MKYISRNSLCLYVPAMAVTVLFCNCSDSSRKLPAAKKNITKPNIIYILADDLGYGDLSCNGQKHFSTPNIDRLAAEGIIFTNHYSGCTVCAPSRSSLMTGQTTGHTPIRGNKEWKPEGQWPLPAEAFTLAEMLRNSGYTTGGFGKWGLGYPGSEGDPANQGFDEFYGYNCQGLAHNYYPSYLWDNGEKLFLQGNRGDRMEQFSADLIQQRVLQFIDKNRDKPFFLFYATTIPHAELLLPEKYMEEFRGKLLPEKVFRGAEPGGKGFRDGAYGTQEESHAAFAGLVTLLDRQVGEIMHRIRAQGLEENTLIIFSSDNGTHLEGGADPDFFDSNGPFRGYKRDLYEGGIHVPMFARWPGKIKSGTTTGHISAFWDIMPTLAEITGSEIPGNMDGISFLPAMLGQKGQKEHEYLYWEFHEQGGKMAVLKDSLKLIVSNIKDIKNIKTELYNLRSDPGETTDLADIHTETVQQLRKLMDGARIPSEIFNFGKQAGSE